jgi:hypothetical protein
MLPIAEAADAHVWCALNHSRRNSSSLQSKHALLQQQAKDLGFGSSKPRTRHVCASNSVSDILGSGRN